MELIFHTYTVTLYVFKFHINAWFGSAAYITALYVSYDLVLLCYNLNSFENKYFEELKVKAEEEKKDSQKEASQSQASQATTAEQKDSKAPSKNSTSTNPEHDLDVFLLGDLGSDDEGPGILFIPLDLIQLMSFYILLQFL
jgi:hypothetical protein